MQVGTDIELIATDAQGVPRSVIDKIPGTKIDPHATDHGHIQVDNVLPEFNIPPASSAVEFRDNINNVLSDLYHYLSPHGLEVKAMSSAFFPDEELQHPDAQEAGCDPDYDIYILDINTKPNLSNTRLRSAGGHVHVSWHGAENLTELVSMVKAMDLFLGVPSILLDPDTNRRSLYGKAGACRQKTYAEGVYGVEYRSLSNFWASSNTLMEWVFNNTQEALTRKNNFDWDKMDHIPSIINNNLTDDANRLVTELGVPMP